MPLQMQPIEGIKADLGIQPNGPVQKFFTNTCYKHMDKYVPKRDGDLRTVGEIGDDFITYEMPYAFYQYYGMREDGSHKINPENYTTPGTGPYWDQRMWSAESGKVVEEVQKYMGG